MTRPLHEVVRTRGADTARHADLVSAARAGTADGAALLELSSLDADLHRFDRMCRGWMPLSLTETGFVWGDVLRHDGDPSITITVRESANVEFEGEDMPLSVACSILAARGVRTSHGGWTGARGSVGDLAGLRHPSRAPERPADDETVPDASTGRSAATPVAATPTKTTPEMGGNYDLFG